MCLLLYCPPLLGFYIRSYADIVTFLLAQLIKNLPTILETSVGFLGWEDPLEKGKATHSSILGLPLWFI